MTTNDPTPEQPTGNTPPPPSPPPPPSSPPPPSPPPPSPPSAPPPQGGYAAPPAGSQGLGSGLAQPTTPGYPPAQQSDETVWALLAHLSYFVLALIGPLIIMLVAGKDRPYAREHAVEALNFHITVFIGVIISIVLIIVLVGIFTLIAIAIAGAVFAIMAAIKAGQGDGYRYPLTIRLVK